MGSDFFRWAADVLDPKKAFLKPEALKGVRVLEVCTLIFGPAVPDWLTDFGAEVIKVELPGMGDTMRYVTPYGFFWKNLSPAFEEQNHNKYHVGLDLRKPEGREIFLDLARRCDAVVENMRAGTLDKWGVGYRDLKEVNPRIVYLANNGFGQWGPYAQGRPSYDAIAQAVSGLMTISGFPGRPPLKAGVWIGDFTGACTSSVALLAAIFYARKTGKGQFIEFSQGENLMRWLDWTWIYAHLTGENRPQAGNRDLAICPADAFKVKDGFVAIAAFTDEEFVGLCEAMGRPELAQDPRFKDPLERLKDENARALLAIIRDWAREKTMAEIDELGARYGFASTPVLNAKDQYESEHWNVRGAVYKFEDPLYGEVAEVGPVPKMSETPGRMKWTSRPVGFDNEHVFIRIAGLSQEKYLELVEKGIIGKWDDRVGAKPPDEWDGKKGLFYP